MRLHTPFLWLVAHRARGAARGGAARAGAVGVGRRRSAPEADRATRGCPPSSRSSGSRRHRPLAPRTTATERLRHRRQARGRFEFRQGAADLLAACRPAGHARPLRRVLPGARRTAARARRRRAPDVPVARREEPARLSRRGRGAARSRVRRALDDQTAAMQVYERLSKTKNTAPDDVLDALRAGGQGRGQPGQGGRGVLAPRVRISVQRSGAAGRRRAREPADRADRRRLESFQARARTRRAAVRRQALRAGAPGVRRPAPGGARRRPRARAAADRRVRLLPEARAQRARRREAVHRQGIAGRARRCTSTPSPRAISAATTNTCASSGASSRSFRRRAGRKKR